MKGTKKKYIYELCKTSWKLQWHNILANLLVFKDRLKI